MWIVAGISEMMEIQGARMRLNHPFESLQRDCWCLTCDLMECLVY